MIHPSHLYSAAMALYLAGSWKCDRTVDEAALWTALRDALGLPAGTSPPPMPDKYLVDGLYSWDNPRPLAETYTGVMGDRS